MLVTFYMPEKYLPSLSTRDDWKSGTVFGLQESGKVACAQCWIYQTWAALQAAGVDCELSTELPSQGIMVALSGFFPDSFRPGAGVFFFGVVADYVPHPSAHLHIVQNRAHAARLPGAVFVPLWPQPNLIPRDPTRGRLFQNVCFLGDPQNLAPELRSPAWAEHLRKQLGIVWEIRRAERWHDYSDVDCVVAIRDFSNARLLHKPASKLYNAWLAGTPFIGGTDSAYAADGIPDENFLQARSPEQLFQLLKRLKSDPVFCAQLTAAGGMAGREFTREKTTARWKDLAARVLPDCAAAHRKKTNAAKWAFQLTRTAFVKLDRIFR